MTEANRQKILDLYRAGHPYKVITARFGVTIDYVAALARRNGCEPRAVHNPRTMVLRVRPAIYDRLRAVAKEQRTSPEVLAREAIAAYLGEI